MFGKDNILLFPGAAYGRLRRPISTESAGLHFQPQTMDEMLDVKRLRRTALHRNVSFEFGGFDDWYQFEAGKAAMGNSELVHDGDTQSRLYQRADGRAKPRTDGDVVFEFLAGKNFGHDAPVGISWVNADQRIADDFRRGNLLAACKWVTERDDAEQLARRKGQEVEAGVIEPIAHRNAIASTKQQEIDRLLDLEDVDVNSQVGVTPPDALDRAGHHNLGNARHRTDAQLRQRTLSDLGDDLGKIIDLLVDSVDLFKNILRFGRRKITPILALEESDAERSLGVFHQPADTRC